MVIYTINIGKDKVRYKHKWLNNQIRYRHTIATRQDDVECSTIYSRLPLHPRRYNAHTDADADTNSRSRSNASTQTDAKAHTSNPITSRSRHLPLSTAITTYSPIPSFNNHFP